MTRILFALVFVLSVSSLASAQTSYVPLYSRPAPAPVVITPTIPVMRPYAPVGPPSIVAADGQFLGVLSSNRYDPLSVANPYGAYGSRYSSTSITNPYSVYGSRYSPLSANNPYATATPVVAPLPWYLR
jgi:hypothetical protein